MRPGPQARSDFHHGPGIRLLTNASRKLPHGSTVPFYSEQAVIIRGIKNTPIRIQGGVEAGRFKKMATPPGPQARRTTEYCCTVGVLPRPTGDHISLARACLLQRGAARLLCTKSWVYPDSTSTPTQLELDLQFFVPRGTGAPHKGHVANDRGVNKEDKEDGVE